MSNATAAAAAAEQILNDYADDATWVLTSSFVILTMQSGFGLLEMGSSALSEVLVLSSSSSDCAIRCAYELRGDAK